MSTLSRLVGDGLSDPEIADRLGVSARTVLRWRQRDGLPSLYARPVAPHGTEARYRARCRCSPCRAANAAAHARLRAAYDARLPAARNGQPWTRSEDLVLLDDELGTLYSRARRVGRSYSAARRRLDVLRRRERASA